MSKVNFIPRGTQILVSSNLVNKATTNLYVGKEAPQIKEVQQVVAVGPEVKDTDVKVGDWVFLDMNKFIQTVKKKSTIRAGIGGEDMLVEKIVIPFFSIPGSEDVYIKINAREIEGVIPDYESLPEDVKSFKTLIEFTKEQDLINDDASKAMSKGMTFPDRELSGGVGLVTETGSHMIKMH